MNIAIHGRPFNDDAIPPIQTMFDCLQEKGANLQIFNPFLSFLEKKGVKIKKAETYSSPKNLFKADFLFSVGGDGTLLDSITYVGKKETPLLGINTGRLGFLAITPRDKTKKIINALYRGDFNCTERTLLRLDCNEDIFSGVNFALNEFAILKKDSSSMIVVHSYIDGKFLNSYWADGLIVATPTGSTGYSLSVGGPLVYPQSSNFIISPVSPHNLNVRPMVVSDNSVISFKIEGRSKNVLVSLDSRSKTVSSDLEFTISKEKFKAKLVEPKGYDFLQTLRDKLNWGWDMRN